MLRETPNTRQIPGEPFRRWFCDNTFDLIVWYDEDNSIIGFQLCYDKGPSERALTWWADKGFMHKRIDDGESRGARPKMTPILVPDGVFKKDDVLTRFREACGNIDPDVVRVVSEAVASYPGIVE